MEPQFKIGDQFTYLRTKGAVYTVVGFDGELVIGRRRTVREVRTYMAFHPDTIVPIPPSTNHLVPVQWGIVAAGRFTNWPGNDQKSCEEGIARLIEAGNRPASHYTLAKLVNGVVKDEHGQSYPLENVE